MKNIATIVPMESLTQITCALSIETRRIPFALQNINVGESHRLPVGTPSRSSQQKLTKVNEVRLRSEPDRHKGYGATAFALHLGCERRLEARGVEPSSGS